MLTPREREVVELLCKGLKAKDVARKLHIDHRTVEKHASHVIEKMGAHNMLHAVTLLREAS